MDGTLAIDYRPISDLIHYASTTDALGNVCGADRWVDPGVRLHQPSVVDGENGIIAGHSQVWPRRSWGSRRSGGRQHDRPSAHHPDRCQRAEVETLAAVLNAEQFADFLGIGARPSSRSSAATRDLSETLQRGKARAVGAVARALSLQARAGNVTATILFLKTQGGWRESVDLAVKQDPIDEIDLSLLRTRN